MQNGFFGSLFDVSFSSLVTPRIIRVVYMILVGLSALGSVVFLLGSLSSGDGAALGVILAPALFLFYVIVSRVYLELVIVIFRIGDDVRRIADRGMGGGPSAGPGPAPRTFI